MVSLFNTIMAGMVYLGRGNDEETGRFFPALCKSFFK